MSYEQVRQIVESKLSLDWGTTTPIAWDNVTFKPEKGVSFIRLEIDNVQSEIVSISCQRMAYLVGIAVLTPYGNGTKENLEFVDMLFESFFAYQEGNFYCKQVTVQRVGQSGEWYQNNVLIEAQYDNHF